jgi:hypothetical protein
MEDDVCVRDFPIPLEVSMKRNSIVLAALFAMSVLAAQAATHTGWISDSMCGAKMTGGTAKDQACVAKCISNGSKPVFVDAQKNVWSIDNPDSVKDYFGDHVRVHVTEDAANKSVHVDSITAAK